MPQDPFAAYVVKAPGAGRPPTAPDEEDPFAAFVTPAAPTPPKAVNAMYGGAGEVLKGAVKGVGSTIAGLGKLVHAIPGVSEGIDAMYGQPGLSQSAFGVADEMTAPTNTPQRIGKGAEQIAEFFIPAAAAEKAAVSIAAKAAPLFTNAPRMVQGAVKLAPRMGAQGASAAGVASAQGADPTLAGAAGAAGAAGPVIGAGAAPASRYLGSKAEALVLSAVKPTVASLRRIAGASATGLEVQATKLARFILETGATTPEKARKILTTAEQDLQRVLALKNAPTDAALRADRYLDALERSASKQGLPADDVALIRKAAADLVRGPMGATVAGPAGTARVLRADVPAKEALDSARASSRWSTRKQWGEQKGASMEAQKAVERAQRDAVKAAVPEAVPILQREGQALTAINALDRMSQRTGNRDALSLPGAVVGAAEVASGKIPLLGAAAHWLRNNQMKAGVWADRLAKAIERKDVKEVGAILNRLGVGATAQAGR